MVNRVVVHGELEHRQLEHRQLVNGYDRTGRALG